VIGLEPSVTIWEDPTVEWAAFDLVVAVYTWGYVIRRGSFPAWAGTGPRARPGCRRT